MPWLLQSSTLTANVEGRALDHPYVPFYEGILEMTSEELLASWGDQPDLNEPRSKGVEGADAFVRWAAQTREWLVGADAATRPVYLIVTPTRMVEEVVIDLTIDGERRELPVAIVAEHNSLGLTAIRVYHSMWPLIRGHLVRSPLLHPNPNITIPDVVGDYQRALAAGDLEGILAAYQDDAVVREPAGDPYVFVGKEAVRHIYTLQFADGAGIPLQHCTVTDDGIACALEWNATKWGHTPIEPQAGIAIYQRGQSGKLACARIYDDLSPPTASDSSEYVEKGGRGTSVTR
jgi:hypothetical protein